MHDRNWADRLIDRLMCFAYLPVWLSYENTNRSIRILGWFAWIPWIPVTCAALVIMFPFMILRMFITEVWQSR